MINFISESEYKQSVYPALFEDEDIYNRMYAAISENNRGYKFAWQSDGIKPCVFEIRKNIFALGVDTNFAIVDLYTGRINMKICLNYFLFDIKIISDFLYVITELEIIKIDKNQYEIVTRYDLPDIFETIEMKDNIIFVKCMDGQSVLLDN